ncbi:MAG TPA: hypothetical protein VLH37_04875 [Bacteroidales bacterium]|nr:hypothetical protein [Bacteroidales bacterium]
MSPNKTIPWLFLPLALLFLQGCMSTYRVVSDPFKIKDFPTPLHNRRVEVIDPEDLTPDKPYFHTHAFEVHHFPGAPRSFQISNLLEMAEGSGVDALVVTSHHNEWVSQPFGRVAYLNVMRAKGIKFKENVDYLHLFPYVAQLYVFNEQTGKFDLIANLTPDFNGHIVQVEDLADGKGNHYYNNYISLYSLDFLLGDQSESWRFRRSFGGQVTRRNFYDRGRRTISLKIHYEHPRKITSIQANFLTRDNRWQPKEFRLVYGANRLIEEKTVLINGVPALVERFIYDELNRLHTSTYYRIENGREIPFLQTHHYYYENRDVFERF